MSDQPADPAATIPLDEWCRAQSATDQRVELLGCFAYRERAAGRHHDTPDAYAARYAVAEAHPVQ